jgi:predicted branched-subunit amino acid permease
MTGLVVLGVALRVWAYAGNPSLFLDEILLSRNILGLTMTELATQPLKLDQVAPRGFLVVEKATVLAFGGSELALRLFPFLCGVAAVFLFRRLATRTLEGTAAPIALALFAIGVPFIKYGAEVKQYSIDAAATVLLLVLVLDLRRPDVTARRLVLVGLVGFVVIWFSQASVIVMGGIGIALGVQWLMSRDRSTGRALLITMPMWAAASLVAIVAGLRSMTPATHEFMDDFWRTGFAPLPLHAFSTVRWLWSQTQSFFTDQNLLHYRWPLAFIVVALLGFIESWRRRRDVALLLLGPIVAATAAAVAQQYPLRGRLMIYLVPIALLAVGAGAGWLQHELRRVHPALGWAAIAGLFVTPVIAIADPLPPYEIENHRTVLRYLQQHRQPGDAVYVFPLSRVGMLYYGPRYGLEPNAWTTAVCDRNDTRSYIRDVDRYRGTPRLWVLTSASRPYRSARAAVRGYLSTIGVKRDSVVIRSIDGTGSLDLFDLSEPGRLRSATADAFPVQPMPTDPRPGCRPWARPSPIDSFP